MESYKLFFDGASKGNPGAAGAGAVLIAPDGSTTNCNQSLGVATNNVAEYKALILGLEAAIAEDVRHIEVFGDSLLVVSQVSGQWKCRDANLETLRDKALALSLNFEQFKISHIPRGQNAQADQQANIGVNRGSVHTVFINGAPYAPPLSVTPHFA